MNTTYQEFWFDLRGKLVTGQITYDEAYILAKPILDEMNAKGKEVAKKYGKRFNNFSFASMIR